MRIAGIDAEVERFAVSLNDQGDVQGCYIKEKTQELSDFKVE